MRKRVLSESGRISRLSRIREFVLGFQDGLLVPLAVVTGLAGAAVSSTIVIVGGLAEAVAGALAMGTGTLLASQAENQLFKTEIADEQVEITESPKIELAELEILLQEEGLSEKDAKIASQLIAKSPTSLKKTMVEKELGLSNEEPGTAWKDAVVVGLSYAGAALIPLWPYFLWKLPVALPASLGATGFALFTLGLVKGRVAGMVLLRSGLQVLLVGGTSAAIGYLIGTVVPRLLLGT